MTVNLLKKGTGPVVDQSLEATRSIEYQLLNMKQEMEKFSKVSSQDVDLAPAVTETLETLHEIDSQLQNMRSLLENYSDLYLDKKGKKGKSKEISMDFDKPSPTPFHPTSPPTFPPTYPETDLDRQPPPHPPWEPPRMHERYYYPPYPDYPPYYPPPYYRERYYSHYYDEPRTYPHDYPPPHYRERYYRHYYEDPRVFPQDYPPFLPPYGYPPDEHQRYDKYYEGAKYPTAASSEPAYSSKFKAVPSQVFKIAYYPWESITGKKSPMSFRTPYVNLFDLGQVYLVYVELPGVEEENIDIRVDDQSVWINGRPTIIGGEEGRAIVMEHGHHEFSRQIYLPTTIIQDKTTCEFENGILKIILQKENLKPNMYKVKMKKSKKNK